jgi:5'-nucleotidase
LELVALASEFGDVLVVAPEEEHSSCGHRTTTDRPLRVRTVRPHWFAVDGTPADCVRVALTNLAPEVEWVLSGINPGGNLGVDIYMSGTVAAAREAALLGRGAVAFSHYMRRGHVLNWGLARERLRPVMATLLERPRELGDHWNVNLPHTDHQETVVTSVFCKRDNSPLPVSFRPEGEHTVQYNGNYHERAHRPFTDVAACFGGHIAISLLTP